MSDDVHGSDDSPHHPPRDDLFRRRSSKNGSNGSRPEGMAVRPAPMDDARSEPLDLVAVQADDELINALAGGMSVSSPGYGGFDPDDQVAAMLAAWKADVDADPIPEIDLDLATRAVLTGRRPSGRTRHLVPVASAAALIVVAITGVSIGAHDARPGDALFSVSKVLYAEEAASYEALDVVEKSKVKARQALAVGDKDGAAAAVAQGQSVAETVLAEHGQGEAMQDLQRLEVAVDETIPGVPNEVEEDEPAAPQSGPGTGSSTTTPPASSSAAASSSATNPQASTTTAPQAPGGGPDGSDGTPDADDTPGSAGAGSPTSTPSSGSGGQSGGSAGPTRQPGTDKPGNADEPGTSSGSSGAQPSGSSGGSESEADAPSAADSAPAEGPGENTAATPRRTTTKPTPQPATSGISGASSSATGTATPSGEPLSG